MKEISLENSKFVDKFTMIASKMGNEIHLRSLRDAFATIMPLYILAGLAVLVNNTIFLWILSGDALTNAQYWGTLIVNGTLNISSLLIAPLVGYMLAKNRGFDNPISAALIALATLVVMMPNMVSITPDGADQAVMATGALTFSNIGTQAMFAGVIIGLLATEVFLWVSSIEKLKIDLGDNIPPSVAKSFNVLIPFILVMAGFAIVSTLLNMAGTNLIQLITNLIQEPLRTVTTGLVGCVILYSLGNFLWLLGIHQSVIYGSILEPLLIVNMTQNMAAYAAGQAIPNIINVAFVPAFGMMGGSGSTICLLIATFLVGRNKATKSVSKMAFVPGIFNINEPVIFGYSIVYNISLIIPFILVPAMGIIIGYLATALNLMNTCVVYIPWTTPVLLSGYLATAGDVRAILVQLLILVLGVLIYIPFVKINDAVMAKTMEE
ncbi:PTS sugar transporter subunit IIC [Brotaphodocola sp.]|uniref:PTS sugar transporter subunit IIC n=1 Tax=Brotaphodocola sp. TaxID=3073577 RepID=UPI003D7D0706